MQLLAFDTSTDTLSIAVGRTVQGQPRVWEHTGAGGAQASVSLIPAILALLQQAEMDLQALDAICFGSGPGSFTGLRSACAVAQGLAFGAGRPVLPVNSLLAVAEEARWHHLADLAQTRVTALLDARMDEMYTATWDWNGHDWSACGPGRLVKPEALETGAHWLAGNVFAAYGQRLGPGLAELPRFAAMPTASAILRLAPGLLAAGAAVQPQDALPLYIRDNVAQTTAERAALKAAMQPPTAPHSPVSHA